MFKKPFNRWFRNVLVLLTLAYFYPGFVVGTTLTGVIIAGLFLFFIQTFFQPILKVLFIPINIITMGMFRWLISTIHLLLIAFLVEPVQFLPFYYEAFSFFSFDFSAGEVNLLFSVIIGSIFYRFIRKIIVYLT